MQKTSPLVILLLVMVLILSGCSNGAASTAAATGGSVSENTVSQSLKEKLAAGTLKLEGTDLAVTAEQAKELLPLWKAVKALSSSDTASQLEIEAVYTQIQEAMSADQLASIEALDLSGQNMQSLMTELGIDPMGTNSTGLTDSERATRVAELQASSSMMRQRNSGSSGGGGMPSGGGAPSGGSMPSGGGDMPSMGGEMPSGGDMGGAMQTTPQPGQAGGFGGAGSSSMFIDPLITLLKTRAAE